MKQSEVKVIRNSKLFDEEWYRKQYAIPQSEDCAEHYLDTGWKEGYDPSDIFSTSLYLKQNADVKSANVNPLLHYELWGRNEGRYPDLTAKINLSFRYKFDKNGNIVKRLNLNLLRKAKWEVKKCVLRVKGKTVQNDKRYRTDLTDGLLRIRITNRCNGRCRYCGLLTWSEEEQQRSMEPKWYYEYCKPLYEKIKIVLITGGDAFVAKESYNYMKFLSDNYPQITVMTESNGIAFNERFRELACENLFKTHFSINASNAEIYQKGCWAGAAGAAGYNKSINNIRAYMELLRSRNLECFGPSLSMVINKDTACDVVDFAKLALELGASCIWYYFDYMENNMEGDYFSCPETSRPALKKLMELERILAKKFFVYFRLWIPTKEADPIQAEVDAEPFGELQKRYADILKLAEGRNMKNEFDLRNRIRAEHIKKVFLFDEEWTPTIRLLEKEGKKVCFAPWQILDLYPNGRMDFCSWFRETLNIKDFIKDEKVDWDAVLNSWEYTACRCNILHDNFGGCMPECPMNSCKSPIIPVHKYGYDRIDK